MLRCLTFVRRNAFTATSAIAVFVRAMGAACQLSDCCLIDCGFARHGRSLSAQRLLLERLLFARRARHGLL